MIGYKQARARLLGEGYVRLFSVPGAVVYGAADDSERYAVVDANGTIAYRDASIIDDFVFAFTEV